MRIKDIFSTKKEPPHDIDWLLEEIKKVPSDYKACIAAIPAIRDLEKKDVDFGDTALTLAIKHRCRATIEALLEAGADPNACDNNKNTALILLCAQTSAWMTENIAPLLLEKAADPNACDKNGASALALAAQNGDDDLITLLIVHGADPDCAPDGCKSPFQIACAVMGETEATAIFVQAKVQRLKEESAAAERAAGARINALAHSGVDEARESAPVPNLKKQPFPGAPVKTAPK